MVEYFVIFGLSDYINLQLGLLDHAPNTLRRQLYNDYELVKMLRIQQQNQARIERHTRSSGTYQDTTGGCSSGMCRRNSDNESDGPQFDSGNRELEVDESTALIESSTVITGSNTNHNKHE